MFNHRIALTPCIDAKFDGDNAPATEIEDEPQLAEPELAEPPPTNPPRLDPDPFPDYLDTPSQRSGMGKGPDPPSDMGHGSSEVRAR